MTVILDVLLRVDSPRSQIVLSFCRTESSLISVLAVLKPELSDPLVIVSPSLCGNTGHFGGFVKEINLEPLVAVPPARRPSASLAAFFLNI